MLGEQFIVGDEICGAVISIRQAEDIVSIWNKTASDNNIIGKIRLMIMNHLHVSLSLSLSLSLSPSLRDTLQRILQLPSQTVMEYKAHDQSIK